MALSPAYQSSYSLTQSDLSGSSSSNAVNLYSSRQNQESSVDEIARLREENESMRSILEGRRSPEETLEAIEAVSRRVGQYVVGLKKKNKNLVWKLKEKDERIEMLGSMVLMDTGHIKKLLLNQLTKALSVEVPNFREIIATATLEDGSINMVELIDKIENAKTSESSNEWVMMDINSKPSISTDSCTDGWELVPADRASSSQTVSPYGVNFIKIEGVSSELSEVVEKLRLLISLAAEHKIELKVNVEEFVDENGKTMSKEEARQKLWNYIKIAASGIDTTGRGIHFVYKMIIKLSPVIGFGVLCFQFPWLPLLLLNLL